MPWPLPTDSGAPPLRVSGSQAERQGALQQLAATRPQSLLLLVHGAASPDRDTVPDLGHDATFEEIRQALMTPPPSAPPALRRSEPAFQRPYARLDTPQPDLTPLDRPRLDTPPIEPYRPDMLPRTAQPDQPALYASRRDDPSDSLRDPYAARPQPSPERTDPAPSIRRESGSSLRESILKKPLSSLYRKD